MRAHVTNGFDTFVFVLDDEVMVNGLDKKTENQTEKRHGIRRFAGFVSR